VLAAVVVAAHLVFRGARVTQTVTDVNGHSASRPTFHFARIDTDYFQANRAPSLVQHFWSLAVEEQFYIVWPVLIVIVLTLTRSLRLLLAVVAVGSAASFGYALHAATQPTTYFSSPARPGSSAWAPSWPSPPGRGRSRCPVRRLVHLVGLAGNRRRCVSSCRRRAFRPAGWPAGASQPRRSLPLVRSARGRRRSHQPGEPICRAHLVLALPVALAGDPVVAALVPTPWGLKYSIAVFAMLGLADRQLPLREAPMRPDAVPPARVAPAAVAPTRVAPTVAPASFERTRRRTPPGNGRPRLPGHGRTALGARPGQASAVVRYRRGRRATRAGPPGPDVAQPHNGLATAIDQALAADGFPDFDPPVDQLGSARGHWGACDGATEDELAQCTFGSTAPDARLPS